MGKSQGTCSMLVPRVTHPDQSVVSSILFGALPSIPYLISHFAGVFLALPKYTTYHDSHDLLLDKLQWESTVKKAIKSTPQWEGGVRNRLAGWPHEKHSGSGVMEGCRVRERGSSAGSPEGWEAPGLGRSQTGSLALCPQASLCPLNLGFLNYTIRELKQISRSVLVTHRLNSTCIHAWLVPTLFLNYLNELGVQQKVLGFKFL
jgi:hypothetical protein